MPDLKPKLAERDILPSGSSSAGLGAFITPHIHPAATTGIVIIFVIFILLQRQDLRNRLIRLAGSHDLQKTTAALDDAAGRLSKLFLTRLALNAAFGLVIGVGLYFIGVPSPVLWGILAAILCEVLAPISLVVNELATKAIKHAFPSGKGEIRISLKRQEADIVRLSVTEKEDGLRNALFQRVHAAVGRHAVAIAIVEPGRKLVRHRLQSQALRLAMRIAATMKTVRPPSTAQNPWMPVWV